MKFLKVYIAGKVAKNSVFGTHYWRDGFIDRLRDVSQLDLINVDPTKTNLQNDDPAVIFGCDVYMISQVDVVIVYLSDDISVGGAQEILIAKYFGKPVIGLAPLGGKFNGRDKEYFGRVITNYQDPFVFTTCDVLCQDIEGVAKALRELPSLTPKTLKIIDSRLREFKADHLGANDYLRSIFTSDH